jgi:hypothetical protein
MPTRRLASEGASSPSRASDRSVGPILAAQPHVRANPVNVFFFKIFITRLTIGYIYELECNHRQILWQGVIMNRHARRARE